MTDALNLFEQIAGEATALIRRRMVEFGVQALHLVLVIAPNRDVIMKSNIGPEGLKEVQTIIEEMIDQVAQAKRH